MVGSCINSSVRQVWNVFFALQLVILTSRENYELTDRQGPAPLVTVAMSDTIPGTVKPKAMASTGTSAIAVSVSDDFWSNTSTISSRSRQKGLQYAVEGYPKY